MYIVFPDINPNIFSIGPISIRWYGFMYFISFIFAMWYGKKIAIKKKDSWYKKTTEKLIYSVFLSACIGGRIGYILFYNFLYFYEHPLHILYIWEGGMSFHGGLIGAILSIFYFSLKYKKKFFEISDFLTPLIPFCLGCGRIGNFINGELWGRIAPNFSFSVLFPASKYQDLEIIQNNPTWKIIFQEYGSLPRHPSQLYEFFLEGIVLFLIIYFFIQKKRSHGNISAVFLIFYGVCRIIVEFFREPDPQIGLFYNIISMGQILSIPMIISGGIIMLKNLDYKK